MNSYELAAATGISYRQLDYWIHQGLFPGTLPGSGRRRDFSDDDVGLAHMMAKLVKAGIKPASASRYAAALLDTGEVQLAWDVMLMRVVYLGAVHEKAPAPPTDAGAISTDTTPLDGEVKYGLPTPPRSESNTSKALATEQTPRAPQPARRANWALTDAALAVLSEGQSPSHPPQSQNPPSQPAQPAGYDGPQHAGTSRSTEPHRGT